MQITDPTGPRFAIDRDPGAHRWEVPGPFKSPGVLSKGNPAFASKKKLHLPLRESAVKASGDGLAISRRVKARPRQNPGMASSNVTHFGAGGFGRGGLAAAGREEGMEETTKIFSTLMEKPSI